MTPDEMRIKLAQWRGWSGFLPRHRYLYGFNPQGKNTRVPRFHDDLNAVHELEKRLTPEQQAQYAFVLHEMHGTPLATFWCRVICSTAAQRCEALCKMLGLTKE